MQSVNIMEWATKKSSHPNKATRAAASKELTNNLAHLGGISKYGITEIR